MVKQSKNKSVQVIKVVTRDIRNMLELTNAIKNLRNDTAEHCDVSYIHIQDIVGNLYALNNIFNFKQPSCEHGHPDYYADFEVSEGDED